MARRRTTRPRRLWRLLASLGILAASTASAAVIWVDLDARPWTRDGRVRAQVSRMAPQISGQIVDLRVTDNQFVRKGDVLYVIDPFDYRVAVDKARAEIEDRAADLEVKRVQAERRASLTTVSTSIEEKQRFAGAAKQAEAAYDLAQAQLAQAKVNLERTQVRSAVNGYVNNLLLRVGDFATAGIANVSVLDSDSYWIDGYFEETKMSHVRVGAAAEIRLMGYDRPLRGRVDSITRGISTLNATPATQGLPSVNPVYTWVRLAQRVPVRIRIEHMPKGAPLVAGTTATIDIRSDGREPGAGLSRLIDRILGRDRAALALDPEATTQVRGTATRASIPVPTPSTIPMEYAAPGVAPGMTQPPDEPRQGQGRNSPPIPSP